MTTERKEQKRIQRGEQENNEILHDTLSHLCLGSIDIYHRCRLSYHHYTVEHTVHRFNAARLMLSIQCHYAKEKEATEEQQK